MNDVMIIIIPPLILLVTDSKGHVTLFSVSILPLPVLPSVFNVSPLITFAMSLFHKDESVTEKRVIINDPSLGTLS